MTRKQFNQDNSVKGVQKNTSLGMDIHVRQVEPDRHHATVSIRKPHKIATWNIRTMLQKGKIENIKTEMKRLKINILGLSEVRWKGAGTFSTDGFTMIYSGGEQHQKGVGIILDPETAKSVENYWPVSDRVVAIKLQGKPFDIGIIQAYAPTTDYEDLEVDKFYDDLDMVMKQLKSQDVKIVMGDFNAKVGKEKIENIVGPFGLGEINSRGERLVEWCKEHNLFISNTWFQNHPRRRWTWSSPGDRTRNQIDYILIQHRFRNAIRSSKSMPGADCDSDHIPVVCNLSLKLKKIKKSKIKPTLETNLLKRDENLKEKFTISVKNKFMALEGVFEMEERWQEFSRCIGLAMEESIPKRNRKQHKKWITTEILDLMEQRRLAKGDDRKYRTLNKEIKRMCKEAKENWLNEQCEELENNKNKNNKLLHEKIREISGKKNSTQSSCIKSKEGNILLDKEDILCRWAEYIEELFDDDRGEKPNLNKPIEGPPILKDEVENAIKKMKHGRAPGPDNIPVEIYDALGEMGIEEITKLVNKIYDTGKIPTSLSRSIFITLPKKPGATECESHRTISLMNHVTKILLRIIMERIRSKIHPEVSETQFGFVADKGTRNAIFTLSMLIERCIQMQKDLYLCFIDYSKAFDKVKHQHLFNILQDLDIDGKDLRIIRNIYWEQESAIRYEGEISEFRPIKRGVRQGCVLSPDLFNIYSEIILRNIEHLDGIKVGGKNINNLRYADDTVLIAESDSALQTILNKVVEESRLKGLMLNLSKTEVMVISKKTQPPRFSISSEGESIRQISSFQYLGYTITQEGRCNKEIKKRIAIAKDSFIRISSVMKNRNIKNCTKIRILKGYVWSVLLYGCECWTIDNETRKRLEAVEMWFLRRMLKISWTEKKSNAEVLTTAGTTRSLIKTIRKRQMTFLGHVYRKNGIESLAVCGKISGRRDRGRQRLTYVESLNQWATNKSVTNNDFLKTANNREEWRVMIADVCSRPGT